MWHPLRTACRTSGYGRLLWVCVLALLAATGCGSAPSASDLTFRGTVQATAHPLVAEYQVSVPRAGQVSVEFGPDLGYGRRTERHHVFAGGAPVRLLVAGMRAETTYHLRARLDLQDGSTLFDADQTFTTGALPPASFPTATVTPAGGLPSGAGVD